MPRFALKLIALTALLAAFCKNQPQNTGNVARTKEGKPLFTAVYGTPVLDGSGSDDVWELSEWLPIDQLWFGPKPEERDFSGRYKLAWDENNLYILAEITDDSLLEIHPEGAERYWDDDCLEIFIDEDSSGGNHQYNYNAFAYHIALDGRVMDMGPDSAYHFFDDHCITRIITRDHVSTWEIAVRIFDGDRWNESAENVPKLLKQGKMMGFALAYSDNDKSTERENCIGNMVIPDKDKNRAWADAGVFGVLYLQ